MKNRDEYYKFDSNAHRAVENATWVLTEKKTGDVIECDYREMSSIVEKAYISYWNQRFSDPRDKMEELKPEDIIIRCLHKYRCDVSHVKKGMVTSESYDQILPEYSIDCYDWNYQCRNDDCRAVLRHVRHKGEKIRDELFCPRCFEHSKYT